MHHFSASRHTALCQQPFACHGMMIKNITNLTGRRCSSSSNKKVVNPLSLDGSLRSRTLCPGGGTLRCGTFCCGGTLWGTNHILKIGQCNIHACHVQHGFGLEQQRVHQRSHGVLQKFRSLFRCTFEEVSTIKWLLHAVSGAGARR
jgi:hypothetical protein